MLSQQCTALMKIVGHAQESISFFCCVTRGGLMAGTNTETCRCCRKVTVIGIMHRQGIFVLFCGEHDEEDNLLHESKLCNDVSFFGLLYSSSVPQ